MKGMRGKLTFLAIGGINTLFSTLCFYVLDALIDPSGRNAVASDVALVLSLFFATPFSYVMQRRFVFRPEEAAGLREFLRFASVSAGMYAFNFCALPLLLLLLNHAHRGNFWVSSIKVSNALVAQVCVSGVIACISWFSHSRFSFKTATVTATS